MPPKGSLETILVVDESALVLELVVNILKDRNFHVLSALKLAGETTEKIDPGLSDVEMPGMSGADLGEALKVVRPDTAGPTYRSRLLR